MDKYKINYIYDKKNDINDIFIKVLNREFKKYILMIRKKEECKVSSSCKCFSLEMDKNCCDEFK